MTKYSSLALAFVCGAALLLGSDGLLAGDAKGSRPAKQDATKPLVRKLQGIKVAGFGERRSEITTEQEFARIFGEEALAKVRNHVDFAKEMVQLVTWTGSSSSYLNFGVKQNNGKITVVVAIETSNPALADNRPHGGLIVMPKNASWEFGEVEFKVIEE